MGGFWTSLSVRSGDQRRVAQAVARLGRTAYVGAALDGWVPVFDADADEQDEAEIVQLGKSLTRALDTSGLAVLVHDGDKLQYWLFDRGKLADEYDSWPGYFEGADPVPAGGDPAILCRTLAVRCRADDVRSVLHELGDHADALFLHESLAEALGLPDATVGIGYRHVDSETDDPDPDAQAFRAGLIHVTAGDEREKEGGAPAGPPRPAASPAAASPAAASPAQVLPFVKPGSASEPDLAELRALMMDDVAEKLVVDGGVEGFLQFLDERLAQSKAGGGPAPLRAQVPFLQAIQRVAPDESLRRRVQALVEAIEQSA